MVGYIILTLFYMALLRKITLTILKNKRAVLDKSREKAIAAYFRMNPEDFVSLHYTETYYDLKPTHPRWTRGKFSSINNCVWFAETKEGEYEVLFNRNTDRITFVEKIIDKEYQVNDTKK